MNWRNFIIALFIAVLLPTSAFAADPGEEDRVARAETLMRNVSHQFVYAFFGRDMLLYYLDEKDDIEAVKALSDTELTLMSEPFNSQMSHYIRLGLTTIWGLTLAYFLLRLGMHTLERAWMKKSAESQEDRPGDRRGFYLKMLFFGAIVLTPVPLKTFQNADGDDALGGVTSLYNIFLFDLLGKSHALSDEGLSELIMSQNQGLSTVKIPNSDKKWDSGTALNEFYSCIRLDHTRQSTGASTRNLVLRKTEDGRVFGALSEGSCHLSMSFGYDLKNDDRIKRIKEIVPEADLEDGLFEAAQKQVFTEIVQAVTQQAYKNSEVLTLPQNGEVEGELLPEDMVMKPWTSLDMSNVELDSWAANCDDLALWNFPHAKINKKDRELYHLLTGRCISKTVTQKLLYPDVFGPVDAFLQSGTLKDNQLPLCMDQSTLAQRQGMGETFIGLYTIGRDHYSSENIDAMSLETCLSSICASNSLASGGMYACSNAISIYDRRLRDYQIMERGSMLSGLYMFNLFTNPMPSQLSKWIFNQTQFTFSREAIEDKGLDGDVVSSVQVTIPALRSDHNYEGGEILSSLQGAIENGNNIKLLAREPEQLSSVASWLQMERLMTCVRNPLQVYDGYVCGNIPQEFNAFGSNMLKLAIAGKTILVAGNAIKSTKPDSEIGSIGGKSVINGVMRVIAVVAGAAASETLVDELLGGGFAVTDEFGYLSKSDLAKYSAFSQTVYAMLYMLAESGDIVYKVFDNILMFMLIFGALFAYVIPFFPYVMVLAAVAGFIYLLMRTILMTGFKGVDAIFDDDAEILNEKTDSLWADWIAVLLKLPLTMIGVVLAWLMSNVVISHVLRHMKFETIFNSSSYIQQLIEAVMMIALPFGVIFVVFNMIMTIIESFYDFAVDWMLGRMTNSPFGDRKAFGMSETRSVMRLMGR